MINFLNITKNYKISRKESVTALDNVSFRVAEGDICFYLGPNGAGKSTTIKLLLGILQPDSGTLEISGNSLTNKKFRKEHLKNIGICVANKTQLLWDVPVIESLELIAKIYYVPKSEIKDRILALSEDLNIKHVIEKPPKLLSLGERVKSDIIASLIHQPKIVYMDEPTIGVDIISKDFIYKFILDQQKKNKTTFFITTHDISWVEKMNTKIILINKGKLLYNGSVEQLRNMMPYESNYVLEFDSVIPKDSFENSNLKELKIIDNKLTFRSDNEQNTIDFLEHCFKNYKVKGITDMTDKKLESIILNLTKKGE